MAESNLRAVRTLVGVDFLARTSYGLSRTPLLPLYAASLGAGPALIGAIGAASTVTGIILKSPVGALSDVIGRRRLMIVGLLVFALAPFLYLLVPSTAALIGIRFGHGLATAIYSPVSMAIVAALAGDRRGESLAWLSNAKTIASLLGAFLGGVVLSAGIGEAASLALGAGSVLPASSEHAFTQAWLLSGALGVAAFATGLLALKSFPKDVNFTGSRKALFGKLSSGLREVIKDGQVLLVSCCEGVQNISVGMLEQFLPIYAVLVVGKTPLEAGLLFGCQTFSTIATKPLFGRLSDTKGRRKLVTIGMFACALPFAALPWVHGLPELFALAIAFGLGEALVTAASSALVADHCKERSLGAAMGVFGTIGDMGHALGPILGGTVIALFSDAETISPQSSPAFRIAFASAGCVIILMTLLFVVWGRDPKPGSAS